MFKSRRQGALISTIIAMSVSGTLYAQQTPPAATTTSAPATTSATTSRPGVSSTTTMAFRFVDARVDDILTQMSERFGFIIIKVTTIGSRVTVQVPDPVNADQAIKLLNSVLQPLGLQTLESHTDDTVNARTVLRIATILEAKKSQIPVFEGADPEKIALTDNIITQVIPLTSVDAVRLRNDLLPMISADADVAANPGANAIIVTDTSAKIRRLVEIIQKLDHQKNLTTKIEYHQLNNADATQAAALINSMFSPTNLGQPTGAAVGGGGAAGGGLGGFGAGGGGGRGGGGGGRGGGGGGGASASGLATNQTARIFAAADVRTNTVVLNGPPDQIDQAQTMLNKIDNLPVDIYNTSVFFIKHMKNTQAVDIAPVLNTIFGGGGTTVGGATAGGRSGLTGVTGNVGTGGTTTGRGGGGAGTRGTAGGGRGGGGAGGGGLGAGGLGAGGLGGTGARGGTTATAGRAGTGLGAGTAAAALAGMAYFVANPDTNSLLVTTDQPNEVRVRSIIDELDKPVPQVLIKVLVADVSHSNTDDLGFEFGSKDLRVATNFAGQSVTFGPQVGTNFGLASSSGSGGLKVGLVEGQVNATLQALAHQSKLDILSRPYILVQDNQEAYMQIGQNVPYITASQVTNTGQTINSVGYTSVGIILDVIPHINPEGLVTLDVSPQVSSLDTSTGVTIATNVISPVFTREIAQSRVAIKNGETIVIGGLMQDQKTSSVDKVPLLGDIPYFGMFFKHTIDSKTKHELLIFLTPHVAMAPDFLQKMTDDEQQTLKLVPSAVQPGTWEQQLKGLNAGATTIAPATDIRIEGRNLTPSTRP